MDTWVQQAHRLGFYLWLHLDLASSFIALLAALYLALLWFGLSFVFCACLSLAYPITTLFACVLCLSIYKYIDEDMLFYMYIFCAL